MMGATDEPSLLRTSYAAPTAPNHHRSADGPGPDVAGRLRRHAGGDETWYGHFSSLAVSVGQYVKQNQVIGYVGSTGISTGPHLHFELYTAGRAVDPLATLR